ncbi:sucrase ferredoxin-like family [Pyrrhoderma noxium]|uniref:Sucrase ferredoxin-like family n=1 Tax=Pyrrhoderma noxium TaxID=2282107 RepID=A0A286UET1_9AGAM|nr:sucrase ferredoxin-like family [Pyrrhoderma noxium]
MKPITRTTIASFRHYKSLRTQTSCAASARIYRPLTSIPHVSRLSYLSTRSQLQPQLRGLIQTQVQTQIQSRVPSLRRHTSSSSSSSSSESSTSKSIVGTAPFYTSYTLLQHPISPSSPEFPPKIDSKFSPLLRELVVEMAWRDGIPNFWHPYKPLGSSSSDSADAGAGAGVDAEAEAAAASEGQEKKDGEESGSLASATTATTTTTAEAAVGTETGVESSGVDTGAEPSTESPAKKPKPKPKGKGKKDEVEEILEEYPVMIFGEGLGSGGSRIGKRVRSPETVNTITSDGVLSAIDRYNIENGTVEIVEAGPFVEDEDIYLLLLSALHDELVERKKSGGDDGVYDKIKLGELSHVGGHKYAANLLVFPWGDWLGNLTAADAPRILDAVSSASKIEITPTSTPREKPPLIADPAHWRGRMGFTKERQIEFMDSHLEEQQTTSNEQ